MSRPEKDANGVERLRGGGADAEAWQILSPVRAGETGVDGLNRWLQKSFRQQVRAWAEPDKHWQRKTCKPLGAQGILYGDKVINVANAGGTMFIRNWRTVTLPTARSELSSVSSKAKDGIPKSFFGKLR